VIAELGPPDEPTGAVEASADCPSSSSSEHRLSVRPPSVRFRRRPRDPPRRMGGHRHLPGPKSTLLINVGLLDRQTSDLPSRRARRRRLGDVTRWIAGRRSGSPSVVPPAAAPQRARERDARRNGARPDVAGAERDGSTPRSARLPGPTSSRRPRVGNSSEPPLPGPSGRAELAALRRAHRESPDCGAYGVPEVS
jgi:hypothetical protein